MTQDSLPWYGTATGDAGPYSDDQWAVLWQQSTPYVEGVFSGVLNELKVIPSTPAARSVNVSTGAAMVQGRFYTNDAVFTLTLAANASGSTRYDRIVIEVNWVAQTVRVVVLQGVPGAGEPALTQVAGTLWQHEIALVTCVNGYASIAAAQIRDDRRAWANTPGDTLINQATARTPGDVMILDTATDFSATTTTSAGDGRVLGPYMDDVANAALGRIPGLRTVMLYGAGAVTRGRLVAPTTVAGQVAQAQSAAFAQALETTGGAGWLRAMMLPRPVGPYATAYGASYNTNSTNYVDVDGAAATFDLTLLTRGGPVLVFFSAYAYNDTNGAYVRVDVYINGATYLSGLGAGGNGCMSYRRATATSTDEKCVSFVQIATGLAPGSNVLKPIFKVSAGTGYLYEVFFQAYEL